MKQEPHDGDLCEHGVFRPWFRPGTCQKCEAECNCADMLIVTGGGRWWCPAHHDFTSPPQYVLDAVRRLNEKVLELSNWKYYRERADAAAGVAVGSPKHADCPFEHRDAQCNCTTRCVYALRPDGANRIEQEQPS